MENIFADYEVINSYTRKEAIEDGTLVDLTTTYPDLCRQLFKFPVAVTGAVWTLIENAVCNERHCNDIEGVIWDILWMSQHSIIKRVDETQHLFQVIITGTGREKYHILKIICHPGDNAEPVLTIMLPDED